MIVGSQSEARFIPEVILRNQCVKTKIDPEPSTTNWLTKSSCVVGLAVQIIEQVSSLVKTFFKLYEIRVQFRRSFRSSIYGPTYAICQSTYANPSEVCL